MKKTLLVGAALFAAISCLAPRAFAGTATGNFNVNAVLVTSCTISAPDMNFGTYDPVNGNFTTSTVQIFCYGIANGTTLSYTVDGGQNYQQGGAAYRAMYSPGENAYLPYTLSATYPNGTDIGTAAGNGTPSALSGYSGAQTLFGILAPGTNVPAGNDYSDTVGLSISF